jgi:hypothetical protein
LDTLSNRPPYASVRNAKWIAWANYSRRHHGLGFPEADSIRLFKPGSVPATRNQYRGKNVPTPWTFTPGSTR